MFKDIKNWRMIEWFSLLVVIAIIAGIVWSILSLGFLPTLFVVGFMVFAAWFWHMYENT